VLLVAFVIAAAMRPGVELLQRRRVPRGIGVTLHYLGLALVIGLLLWLIVPHVLTQVQQATGSRPAASSELHKAVTHSHGIRHEILLGIERRLSSLPHGHKLGRQAIDAGKKALEILVGIFFTLAVAAYWIFEKERAQSVILRLVAPKRRKVIADTW